VERIKQITVRDVCKTLAEYPMNAAVLAAELGMELAIATRWLNLLCAYGAATRGAGGYVRLVEHVQHRFPMEDAA